jgi:chromosome segregation ATPase
MYIENDASITHRRYYSPEFMKSSIKTLELLHKNISDFPKYTQWMVLNIIMSAEANLKRVRDSREKQEAQAPEIQEKFDEIEKEYQFWLNRYSDEEKTLSNFFKNSREEILKSLSENKQKVSTLKHKLKRANQRISALESSASWKITAPLRAILKIFIKH